MRGHLASSGPDPGGSPGSAGDPASSHAEYQTLATARLASRSHAAVSGSHFDPEPLVVRFARRSNRAPRPSRDEIRVENRTHSRIEFVDPVEHGFPRIREPETRGRDRGIGNQFRKVPRRHARLVPRMNPALPRELSVVVEREMHRVVHVGHVVSEIRSGRDGAGPSHPSRKRGDEGVVVRFDRPRHRFRSLRTRTRARNARSCASNEVRQRPFEERRVIVDIDIVLDPLALDTPLPLVRGGRKPFEVVSSTARNPVKPAGRWVVAARLTSRCTSEAVSVQRTAGARQRTAATGTTIFITHCRNALTSSLRSAPVPCSV